MPKRKLVDNHALSGHNSLMCINPACMQQFSSVRAMSAHYRHHPSCLEESNLQTNNFPEHDANSTGDTANIDDAFSLNYDDVCEDDDSMKTDIDYLCNLNDDISVCSSDSSALCPDDSDGNSVASLDIPDIHTHLGFSKQMFHQTTLLKILNDAHAPHYLYEEIMKWAKNAIDDNFSFQHANFKRQNVIKSLTKTQHLEHCFPKQILVPLDSNDIVVEVTCWDFVSQLFSLLNAPDLTMDLKQLDVNHDDPFSKFIPTNGKLGPFNSGDWYQKSWDQICEPNSKDWMCPIIFGCDATLVGSHLNRGSVTLLNFTLSIFNQDLRACQKS